MISCTLLWGFLWGEYDNFAFKELFMWLMWSVMEEKLIPDSLPHT